MREPPLGLDAVPDPAIERFFDEILAAPTTGERYMADTNPLTDAPSVRVCRFARLELADMIAF